MSNADYTTPLPCNEGAKKGLYMLIDGKPCKISEVQVSKTGKHGHAKAHITGIDIFTGKKYEINVPTSHNVDVPIIVRNKYLLTAIEDNFMSLLDDNGNLKNDMSVPSNELGDRILDYYSKGIEVYVEIMSSMGNETVSGIST